MGGSKTSTNTSGSSNSQTTYTASPEERELNAFQLQNAKELNPQTQKVNSLGLDLVAQLLQGGSLPGYLNKLPNGIDESVTSDIVKSSLRDIQPQFQQSGLLDSGVNASISARTAGDIRRASAETNMNNLFNLLNLATGSSAQIQSPILSQTQMLSGRLAGLRSTNTSGTYNQSSITRSPNPFLESFQKSLGTGAAAGTMAIGAGLLCYVAAEVFDGWEDVRTHNARTFILEKMPKWFIELYSYCGEGFARFIKNHKVLRSATKGVFEVFAFLGKGLK